MYHIINKSFLDNFLFIIQSPIQVHVVRNRIERYLSIISAKRRISIFCSQFLSQLAVSQFKTKIVVYVRQVNYHVIVVSIFIVFTPQKNIKKFDYVGAILKFIKIPYISKQGNLRYAFLA